MEVLAARSTYARKFFGGSSTGGLDELQLMPRRAYSLRWRKCRAPEHAQVTERAFSYMEREMRMEYDIHNTMESVGQSLQHSDITYIIMYNTHMRRVVAPYCATRARRELRNCDIYSSAEYITLHGMMVIHFLQVALEGRKSRGSGIVRYMNVCNKKRMHTRRRRGGGGGGERSCTGVRSKEKKDARESCFSPTIKLPSDSYPSKIIIL
ncbi:unnamed protein product [Trichogramma brassicae]|uniref:Uncharacterized protein n=1 Tax=Trichogramma brassicae TaxID=86971 RepID=A0A6H5IQL1_9HYME|nr:unnamed protein product [Trichogramma brassicae]